MGNDADEPDVEDRGVLTRAAPNPDLTITYGPLPDHCADGYLSDRPDLAAGRPLLLLIHGGYWRPAYNRAHLRPFADALARAGWQVASIEYRRIPGAPDAMADDVRAAIAAIPAQVAGHNGTVLLIGHSAGGHLALWAAAQPGINKVVAGAVGLAAVSDLQLAELLDLDGGGVCDFLGCSAQARDDLNPLLLQPMVPVVNMHGKLDSLVPIELSRNYAAAHAGCDVKLIEIDGIAHFELIDPMSIAWEAVVQVLLSLSPSN